MTDTLRRIARIQKFRETEARRELARAQEQERADQAQLDEMHQAVAEQRSRRLQGDADDLARHHAWSLRMEMDLRRQEGSVKRRETHVHSRRREVLYAARALETTRNVMDHVQRREATERRRHEDREISEIGATLWWRNKRGSK